MLLQRTPMLRGLLMLRGLPPMLLLPPRKTLKNAFMEVGGGEEGDQGRDASRVNCGSGYKHQRSVFDISVTRVHEGESAHGLGEPEKDL